MSDTSFFNFLETFRTHGLEAFDLFYSITSAQVVRNDDPDLRGQIQVTHPHFGEPGEPINRWISPCFDGAGPDRGSFLPPEVGDIVRIAFERGNPDKPVAYWGGWHPKDHMPAEFAPVSDGISENPVPKARGFISRGGHRIIWSDEKDNESIQILWHKPDPGDVPYNTTSSASADRAKGKVSGILFQPNGNVLIVNPNGTLVELDAENKQFKIIDENSNMIAMDSDGIKLSDKAGNLITIDGGVVKVIAKGEVMINAGLLNVNTGGVVLTGGPHEPGVMGDALFDWLKDHKHNTAFGPSSPPVPPPPETIKSKKVKVG